MKIRIAVIFLCTVFVACGGYNSGKEDSVVYTVAVSGSELEQSEYEAILNKRLTAFGVYYQIEKNDGELIVSIPEDSDRLNVRRLIQARTPKIEMGTCPNREEGEQILDKLNANIRNALVLSGEVTIDSAQAIEDINPFIELMGGSIRYDEYTGAIGAGVNLKDTILLNRYLGMIDLPLVSQDVELMWTQKLHKDVNGHSLVNLILVKRDQIAGIDNKINPVATRSTAMILFDFRMATFLLPRCNNVVRSSMSAMILLYPRPQQASAYLF